MQHSATRDSRSENNFVIKFQKLIYSGDNENDCLFLHGNKLNTQSYNSFFSISTLVPILGSVEQPPYINIFGISSPK